MPINPFIIIFSVLLVILCLVYCVLKKPRKPIMTGVFIALLIIYITCTFLINMVLSASSDSIISYDIVCSIVNLCIFQNSPA
ncbi:MAG: hypothetical protein Q8876_08695, partial [Bacillota bacterium]|nr:hypothetical protein [Bacillota bacterium]